MIPICDKWKNQLKTNENKSNYLSELSHLLHCHNVSCLDNRHLKQKISFLTSTIKDLKKVRNQFRQQQKKIKLNTTYHFSLIRDNVLRTLDLWYNVLKFNTVNSMIGNTRICKYWHQYTIQALTHIRIQLIGKNSTILALEKQSVHSWFSSILHLDYRKKKIPIIFGLAENRNLILKNLNVNIEVPLPLTLDVWIQKCKNFKNNIFLLERQWKLEWLQIYFHQFPNEINKSDTHGSHLIHWACQTGYLEVVKILLNYNQVDYNVSGAKNISTLAFALQSENISIIKLLVEKKISVNKETCGIYKEITLCYPIHIAAEVNKTRIIQILLDNGANPFLVTNENKNAFDLAKYNYGNQSFKLLMRNFIKLANQWNIKYTIEITNQNENEKLCFVMDESHFYTIPVSSGDGSLDLQIKS